MPRKSLPYVLLCLICVLTVMTRIGGITTDWQQRIPDWHPDSARYFAQEKSYIEGNYRPIAPGPLYTGNPYGNILILNWIWHGLNNTAKFMGIETPIGTDPFTLSKIGRATYIFTSLFLALLLFYITRLFFRSISAALFGAFFFAVSPLAIGLTHTIKPEIPLTFFLTLSAFFSLMLTRGRKVIYYILAGIFAGIATAVKYNGVISLPFLFIIHVYTVFTEEKGRTTFRRILHALFSPSLLPAILFWGGFFYAFEPVLWHNLKTGLAYIQGYLRVAAYVGTPRGIYGHSLKTLAYNLRCAPGNLWLFLKCASTPVAVLALLGIFSGGRKNRVYLFAVFPALILAVLFVTKSLFGEEYLLHPLPFVFVLAGLGCQHLIDWFQDGRYGKIIVFCMIIPLIMLYGLYTGLKEATYASIGNIRYYANEWAAKNLEGQCIKYTLYTLLPGYHFCRHHPAIFVVPSEKTIKKKYRLPKGSILLKTFQVEKNKPLLHHLRGHRIRFFAYGGKGFLASPIVPRIPRPNLHARSRKIVRFLNGIDLDPGHNTFSLAPGKHYSITLISPSKLKSIEILLKNSNVVNKVHVLDQSLKLLPFETKTLRVSVTRRFPWTSPYLYTLTLASENDLLISLKPKQNKAVKSFVTRELLHNETNFWPLGGESFSRTFESIFHYDPKFLDHLLARRLPLASLVKIDRSTDFYRKKAKRDYCLFYREPVFLEKGIYTAHLNLYLCLDDGAKLTFKVITPSRVLCEKVITTSKIENLGANTFCPGYVQAQLPFETDAQSLVHFLIEAHGRCKIKIQDLSIRTEFQPILGKKIQAAVAQYILKHKDRLSLNLAGKLQPEKLNVASCLGIATFLEKEHLPDKALAWYETAFEKNPLCKRCASRIVALSADMGRVDVTSRFEAILHRLQNLHYGPWRFETGYALNAFIIPQKIPKSRPVTFTLYLSLPNISGDQAVELVFRNGKTCFGKSLSLLTSKKTGGIFTLSGSVKLPRDTPPGNYDVYFTFKIPKEDYRYRVLENGKPSIRHELKIGRVRVL